ncbi:UDP-glucose 4-epimerase GalE [Alkalilimnicola sp. S0819]|uniref:UDP-glucose 4-epimerase GalE n=1 Tax=Alkalilimnicola sp. S0819 TaxID=2613922 RepID=UPI0012614554|nr:UDP-glucose 4-epimerase GalE [Alkalilimnicola sp. S0819]KAB7622868.1 UDP-glucose 4-epimerase GalE [Alkalilimnicola sp. S0819]MPQ17190.1 UDP-glucose 4-epimerase GalE [Alkalilimnicola sp. S0819]
MGAKEGTILVTGGAGYIGSHVVRQLGEQGERVLVLDNLSTGHAQAVLHGQLVIGDVGDRALLRQLLGRHRIDTVMHFAANTVVPESVRDPLKYYGNNAANTHCLLEACQGAGVRHFVFSSTAAVYGGARQGIVDETTPVAPITPYGASKLMSEWMLRDLASASPLRHVTLRYFNVAGNDPLGRLGQDSPEATLLIKVACQAAAGKRPRVEIFGTDYPTEDGTCVRDYIHVEDLALAHIKALDYLRAGGESTTLNCGYGHGYSVRQVLDAVAAVSGKPLPTVERPRRPGDPSALVADAARIRRTLNWRPCHDDLHFIIRTALDWELRGWPAPPIPAQQSAMAARSH